jgi:hypothetical protein
LEEKRVALGIVKPIIYGIAIIILYVLNAILGDFPIEDSIALLAGVENEFLALHRTREILGQELIENV